LGQTTGPGPVTSLAGVRGAIRGGKSPNCSYKTKQKKNVAENEGGLKKRKGEPKPPLSVHYRI
jgi:hypothetical protein